MCNRDVLCFSTDFYTTFFFPECQCLPQKSSAVMNPFRALTMSTCKKS